MKWQNVCINIQQAFKELVVARSLEQLKEEEFRKMTTTLCSRLVKTLIEKYSTMIVFRLMPVKRTRQLLHNFQYFDDL